SPLSQAPIPQQPGENEANILDALLRFGGQTTLGDIALKGLLSGTRNSSPFAGALISRKGITPASGVSYDINPDATIRTGGLFAIGTDGKSLYAGPRVAFDAVEFSAGLQVNDLGKDSQSGISSRFAGAVSFDLSRLLGQKTQETTLKVANPRVGGWGASTSEAFRGFGFIEVVLFLPQADTAGFLLLEKGGDTPASITIRRDERLREGTDKTLGDVVFRRYVRREFLPLGDYQIRVPSGFERLKVGDDETIT